MSPVNVASEVSNLDLCQADRLSTEPVTMENPVCIAIQRITVVKRFQNEVFREDANSTSKVSTATTDQKHWITHSWNSPTLKR